MKKYLGLFSLLIFFSWFNFCRADTTTTAAYAISNNLLSDVEGGKSVNTWSYSLTVPNNYANNNYLMCVMEMGSVNYWSSATYDGKAMTLLGDITGGLYNDFIFGAANVSYGSAKNLVLNWNSSAQKTWEISCFAFSNIAAVNRIVDKGTGIYLTSPNRLTWQDTSNLLNSLLIQILGVRSANIQVDSSTGINLIGNYYGSGFDGTTWSYGSGSMVVQNWTDYMHSPPATSRGSYLVEFQTYYGVNLNFPQSGSQIVQYDRSVALSGYCDTNDNGSPQLSIQTNTMLPIVQPTCDCLNNSFTCNYFVPAWGTSTVCVLDKDNPSVKNSCSTFSLVPSAGYSTPTSTPYININTYFCDVYFGCYFPQMTQSVFNYNSGDNWGTYTTSTLPFQLHINGSYNSSTTKLEVDEISSAVYPYTVLNIRDSGLISSLTGFSNNSKVYSSDFTATTSHMFMVKLTDAGSGALWDTQSFTVNLYSALGAALAPNAFESNKLFQKTQTVLRTKLLFAQFFAFYDALINLQSSTSTPQSMIFYINMPSSTPGKYQAVEAIDLATSTPQALASGFRPYAQFILWITFALYVFTRAKTLFSPAEDEE